MVSGRSTDEPNQVTVRRLPANRSQSSTSIPTVYHHHCYHYPSGEPSSSSGYLPQPLQHQLEKPSSPAPGVLPSLPAVPSGGVPHAFNRLPNQGRYQYHRTLSSSSLLNQKTTVSKSRSDYCGVGRTPPSPQRFFRDKCVGSGSGGNIVYIDEHDYDEERSSPGFSATFDGREVRDLRLIRESSQPIIVHVPITAPKATATTLSRATSPPPPHSPKKTLEATRRPKPEQQDKERGWAGRNERKYTSSDEDESDLDGDRGPQGGQFARAETQPLQGREVEKDVNVTVEERTPYSEVLPSHLEKYCRNASLKKVNHPLEENIFASLLITLVAVAVALIIGLPVLFVIGFLLCIAVAVRYSLFVLHGCYSFLRFICSNQCHSSIPTGGGLRPPRIFPRDRLAFANDVRWIGRRRSRQCQSILHTLLVFDGTLDLGSLRHLVLNRVIHAETPEGELAYPRLLHKVIAFPAGYRWELDVTFDIQNHIFAGPSHIRNEVQIQEYLGQLLTERLSLSKPLWEIRVLTNYGAQSDTVAILRVHQSLADGMTLVRILSHSLADHAQMHIPTHPHFAGQSFCFNLFRSLIVGPLTFFMWIFTTFRDCNLFSIPLKRGGRFWQKTPRKERTFQGQGADAQEKTGGLETLDKDNNESPKSGQRPRRVVKIKRKKKRGNQKRVWNVIWSASLSMPKVSRVKQIMRSSLNDVLLSAAAGSVRSYLQDLGIPCPGDVKVVIPIDLRNDSFRRSSTKLGCKVASVLATIPSGMEGAIPRLWATRHRLDELKASADPVVAYGATTVFMNILPRPLAVSVLDSITNKASLQFSNLPGPTHTLVIGGYPLKGIYPIYPPTGRIRVGISVLSYADQIHLTVVAHRSLLNAGPSLLQGITAQVDQLSKQLSSRRVPGESRRSARNASLANSEMTKPPTRQIHMQLQFVQKELQQLSHRLDAPEELPERHINIPSSEESLGGGVPQAQIRNRLKTLKTEFNELMGELRRRSSIVEGVPMSFEDEETEDDFRKPRKRALSVVSMGVSMSRRNSLFSGARSLTTPESSGVCYSSDEDDYPSSPSQDVRMYNHPPQRQQQQQQQMRLQSSPMKTTAV